METKFSELKKTLGKVKDIEYAMAVLDWDQQTYMPSGGANDRAEQFATLAEISHSLFTSPKIGEMLDHLDKHLNDLDPESDDACLIRVTKKNYSKALKIPELWVSEHARETSMAHARWEKAKATNDYAHFAPSLKRIFELKREYSSFFLPYQHIYDPLLDEFEPGFLTKDLQELFSEVRESQVALIEAINEKTRIPDRFLFRKFSEKKQNNFGKYVISKLGYDWLHGRQDTAQHPFTTSLGSGDVRITTRFSRDYFPMALFGSIHECGHALYDQGLSPSLSRTPLATGASMAVHESQSRLWENLVGRSRAFWVFFYPRLKKEFPVQFEGIDLETFYRGINVVKASPIRVEADEATYNLHIMLRLELEIAMLEGSIDVKSLPDAWNEGMKRYLGVSPKSDSEGVLQDVHWAFGGIGYFPTYAIGNLIASQLWEKIEEDIPRLDKSIQSGDFQPLLGWLREKIHKHGAKFEPQVLVKKVTGSPIKTSPYLNYLQNKYSEIYGL